MAKKRKKKVSPIEQQYRKERRRIMQAISRQEKRGYIVPEAAQPLSVTELKQHGIDINQPTLEYLKTFTPQFIREVSPYVDPETGEFFEPVNPEFWEGYETEPEPPPTPLNLAVIEDINRLIMNWEEERPSYWEYNKSVRDRKSVMLSKLRYYWEDAILQEGIYELAYRLEESALELHELVERVLVSSDGVETDELHLAQIVEILTGREMTRQEMNLLNLFAQDDAYESLRGF